MIEGVESPGYRGWDEKIKAICGGFREFIEGSWKNLYLCINLNTFFPQALYKFSKSTPYGYFFILSTCSEMDSIDVRNYSEQKKRAGRTSTW